ncbi:hypothetical protein ABZU76_15430 [Amycolatopsis sp. NPDC005232]|uniref:hypothetical protein n=1 Tax=Amycolatopsis sp. NPDC005232 TaxID=3157027 RepID=UPI0033A298E4
MITDPTATSASGARTRRLHRFHSRRPHRRVQAGEQSDQRARHRRARGEGQVQHRGVGAIEEVGEERARAQIETNLFGALLVTPAVVPILR